MKSKVWISLVLLLSWLSGICRSEPGLILHYRFDDNSSSTVKDMSGRGHHGTLSGDARYVPWGDSYAVEFFGPTGCIEPSNPTGLRIKGDMTVEAWVKCSDTTHEDQLILGNTSGYAVDRNFLFFNSKGHLRCDHGNSEVSETFMLNEVVFSDRWMHVAFVAEYPHYYFYVDGACVARGQMTFDITPTRADVYKIGGWWAGYFHGMIGELRLYSRALSSIEIARHGKLPATPEMSVAVGYTPQRSGNTARVELFIDNVMTKPVTLRTRISSSQMKEPIGNMTDIKETRPRSGRYTATLDMPLNNMPPGQATLDVEVLDADNKVLARKTRNIAIEEPPAWLNSRAGISDKVMAPWTPITAKSSDDGIAVGVWGREYHFGTSLFPTRITTKSKDILAEPVRVILRRGTENVAATCAASLQKSSHASAVVHAHYKADDIVITAEHTIEYDGFIRTDWKIVPDKPVRIDSLAVEIPIKSDHAIYYYRSPAGNGLGTGQLANGTHDSPFVPVIWVGDDERGLQWVCESTHNWILDNEYRAVIVTKNDDTTVIRFNLVDHPVQIVPDEPLEYTFGLQASPVKPITRDTWDYAFAGSCFGTYGHDYDLIKSDQGRRILDKYQQAGIKTYLFMNWSDILCYPAPVGHEQDLRDFIDACHKRGMRVMVYLGYQISEQAPEWDLFGQEVIVEPKTRNPDKYPGNEPQMVDAVCLRSVWQDFLMDRVDKLFQEYDLDGIYWDSVCNLWPCQNTRHGCGYEDPDGQAKATYAVFSTRQTLKRLYNIVRTHEPDGLIDIHVWDMMLLPALSWSTSFWNGEQLTNADTAASQNPSSTTNYYLEYLPLDRFRTDMIGTAWGIPGDLLHYRLGSVEKCLAISLLHDVPVRSCGVYEKAFNRLAAVRKLMSSYDRTHADWLPYWKNNDVVQVSDQGGYVSLYRHPHNGVLMICSNLTNDARTYTITFDRKKLGLTGSMLTAENALTGDALAVDDNSLQCDLPGMGWKYIHITSSSK